MSNFSINMQTLETIDIIGNNGNNFEDKSSMHIKLQLKLHVTQTDKEVNKQPKLGYKINTTYRIFEKYALSCVEKSGAF